MLKALSLDPLSMLTHTCVGDAYFYARDYERSLVYYRKAVELDPPLRWRAPRIWPARSKCSAASRSPASNTRRVGG